MMRRRIGVGLCLLLVVGAVSYGLSRIGAGARAERGVPPARKATVATEPAARPVVFQMAPAPWILPSPLSRAVALPAGNRIRLFGGLGPANSTTGAVVDVDPATGRDAPVGSLVDPVHDAAGAVIGGGQVVFGGGSSTVVAAVQSLGDQQGSAVTRRGALPAPRADLATATVGGRAILVGGYDGAAFSADVLATTDGTSFEVLAQLPQPVRYPAVVGGRTAGVCHRRRASRQPG